MILKNNNNKLFFVFVFQTQEPVDSIRSVAKGFEDTLQCPLQVGAFILNYCNTQLRPDVLFNV